MTRDSVGEVLKGKRTERVLCEQTPHVECGERQTADFTV